MAFGAVDPAAVQSWERQGKKSFYRGKFSTAPTASAGPARAQSERALWGDSGTAWCSLAFVLCSGGGKAYFYSAVSVFFPRKNAGFEIQHKLLTRLWCFCVEWHLSPGCPGRRLRGGFHRALFGAHVACAAPNILGARGSDGSVRLGTGFPGVQWRCCGDCCSWRALVSRHDPAQNP